MCNWSEAIKETSIQEGIKEGIREGIKEGIKEGIQEGIKKERLNAVGRMIRAGAAKEQIISFGYTEGELAEAESLLCPNA